MLKVLAAVDGSPYSERAVKYIIRELKRGGPAEVHLVHVQPDFDARKLPAAANAALFERARLDDADGVFEAARRLLSDAAVHFVTDTETGDPAQAIAHYAETHGCDEIVMGTRGRNAIQNLLLGTVAMKTLHLANVPVTLVK